MSLEALPETNTMPRLTELFDAVGKTQISGAEITTITWSADAKRLLEELRVQLTALPEPVVDSIQGCGPYGTSYRIYPYSHSNEFLLSRVEVIADAWDNLDPDTGCYLLKDMIPDSYASFAWHKLWTLLREVMHAKRWPNGFVLYAPLSDDGKRERPFPLHSDLYGNCCLANIYDDVAEHQNATQGGRPCLLHIGDFLKSLNLSSVMPSAERLRLLDLFLSSHQLDAFDELFDLLHNPDNPWHTDLQALILKKTIWLPIDRGTGYFVDDRLWMHGREAMSAPASEFRLHRIVIGSSPLRNVKRKNQAGIEKSITKSSPVRKAAFSCQF